MPQRTLQAPLRLEDIARQINGTIHGDTTTTVGAVCPIEPGEVHGLGFARAKSPTQLEKTLRATRCAAAIVSAKAFPPGAISPIPVIVVPDPVLAMTKVVPLFFEGAEIAEGISTKADIHPSAQIGKNVRIGPFCAVGPRVTIADDVVLHPHVVLYPGVTIGARSVLHSGVVVREECELGADSVIQNGAVIGADGFGYTPDPSRGLVPVPQVGTVALSRGVDVGANSCIDRATLGQTKIKDGTKIDNLVQIGHNTEIGRHSIVCGQVGIAGSCTIGDGVVLAGSVGVADHITIAAGARFAARAGVTTDIESKGDYAGHPAVPVQRWNRAMAALLKLGKRGGKE